MNEFIVDWNERTHLLHYHKLKENGIHKRPKNGRSSLNKLVLESKDQLTIMNLWKDFVLGILCLLMATLLILKFKTLGYLIGNLILNSFMIPYT